MGKTLRSQIAESRSFITETISIWLSGMIAGQIIIFAFIADIRELQPVSTGSEWALAIGLLALAIVIPALVIYLEVQESTNTPP